MACDRLESHTNPTPILPRVTRLTPSLAFIAAAMAALFPTVLFTAPKAANACFSVLLVCAILMWVSRPRVHGASLWAFVRAHPLLCLAFIAMPLSIALAQWLRGDALDVPYSYKRIALFVPICWLLMQVPAPWLRAVRWGWILSTALSAFWLYGLLLTEERPGHVGYSNLIPFTDLSLTMGVLGALSIGWTRKRLDVVLGAVALLFGLYVALASGTRGSWLAIPFFVMSALFLPRHASKRWIFGAMVAFMLAVVAVSTVNRNVAQRAESVVTEWQQYDQGHAKESSTAFRLQLWGVSWRVFQERPLAGVGPAGFVARLHDEVQAGRLPKSALEFSHSHNEALWAMSTGGLLGVSALLAWLFVPASFFAWRLRSRDLPLRTSAVMGFATCAGFAAFGLTEVLSVITLNNAFYTLTLALLAADVLRREAELAAAPPA